MNRRPKSDVTAVFLDTNLQNNHGGKRNILDIEGLVRALSKLIVGKQPNTHWRGPATMAGSDDDNLSPFAPLLAELARMRRSNLTAAIHDVDTVIELLTAAREQVAGGTRAPHSSYLSLCQPSNPLTA